MKGKRVTRLVAVAALIASSLVGGSDLAANASSIAIVPTCHSSQLRVEQGRVGAAMGSIGITAAGFRNISKTACTLKGYPTLQMFDANGHRISTHVMHGASASVPFIATKVVMLRAGQAAKFDLGYANQTGYGLANCLTSARVTVTPPHNLKPISAPWKLQPYGGSTIAKLRCGEITVSPVYYAMKTRPTPSATGKAAAECAPSAVREVASTTKHTYQLGTPVKMFASIRNTSTKTCNVVVGQNSPSFSISNARGVAVWNNCYVNGQPGACRMSLILKTLKPGTRYSARATWNQQPGTQPNQIAAGAYTLTASFSGYTTEKIVRFTLIK